jgi:hypothetical protein
MILKTKKKISRNDRRKSRQKSEINDFAKTITIIKNKISCDSKTLTFNIQILDLKNQACKLV